MKKIIVLMLVLASLTFSLAQRPIDVKQLMFGVTGVQENEIVTHTISAQGIVWELHNSIYWIKSFPTEPELNPLYFGTTESVGNVDPNTSGWDAAFNFKWRQGTLPIYPSWGLGLYKISNSKNPDNYFYLDARESKYGSSGGIGVDIHIWYDSENEVYKYRKLWIGWENIAYDGEVVSVWEIKNREYFRPNILEYYWQNVLVLVNAGQDHPRLIWGLYPDDEFVVEYYKIYKKKGDSNFQLLDIINQTEYIDEDETIPDLPSTSVSVQYYITAYGQLAESGFESDPTNTVSIYVKGGLEKRDYSDKEKHPFEYSLEQNYPNPFNPSTTIIFAIPEDSEVSLKIYDVLGKEVAVLLNNYLEAGEYSVYFDVTFVNKEISSGIYLYKLATESRIITKKMVLLK